MRLRERWRRFRRRGDPVTAADEGQEHLLRAADSLRALLDDASIPAPVRASLAADYSRIELMLD